MAIAAFAAIIAAARARHGAAALEARLPTPKTADELRATPDDRYLSTMQRRIFQAGLKHSMVDAKWPAFEEAFSGFDPRRVRAMPDEALEKLLADARLIRHWGKLKSVRDNAAAVLAVAAENGSFASWIAGWPGEDIVGLWEALAQRFRQMGGNSGPTFLRMVGKDTFILTPPSSPRCGIGAPSRRRPRTGATAPRCRPPSTPGRRKAAGRSLTSA